MRLSLSSIVAALPVLVLAQTNTTSQTNTTGPIVDLGYSRYQGTVNTTAGHNVFKGIRYAAAPLGDLRFREPQPPVINRTSVISAATLPNQCPQSGDAPSVATNTTGKGTSSEDCLFLSVYAPANATNLPVLFWIHGGGYGVGNGSQNMSPIITANNNSFVGVAIQYRLGAFGFLSSAELAGNGTANAGLYDMMAALQWVQDYIHLFGGNSSAVTISGESAGGGSVMLLDMAYGGTLGTSLFVNSIAASPYLPMQFNYRDAMPSQNYYAFAEFAGCSVASLAFGNSSTSVLDCLRSADTVALQRASAQISGSGVYGTWGFLPVTDGKLVQQLPSAQLLAKQVNGERLLVGNNADEGPLFVPQTIKTEDDLISWLQLTFSQFSESDIEKILMYYPSIDDSVNAADPKFATNGLTGASALNQSDVATGQLQRANNIYAETTFVCPSYWMTEAYSNMGRSSYKYQYSVPAATHGSDVAGYFGPASPQQRGDFGYAFMRIWGNFVTQNNPSLSNAVANGAASNVTTTNAATNWPAFSVAQPYQMNLNTTGGQLTMVNVTLGGTNNTVTEHIGPGLTNNFTLVNMFTWEAGRGYRCDFWRSMGTLVPE